MPGGHVPHWQKLHVSPPSRGSPHGIAAPVQAHVVPTVVQVMPDGQSAVLKPPQAFVPPPQFVVPQ